MTAKQWAWIAGGGATVVAGAGVVWWIRQRQTTTPTPAPATTGPQLGSVSLTVPSPVYVQQPATIQAQVAVTGGTASAIQWTWQVTDNAGQIITRGAQSTTAPQVTFGVTPPAAGSYTVLVTAQLGPQQAVAHTTFLAQALPPNVIPPYTPHTGTPSQTAYNQVPSGYTGPTATVPTDTPNGTGTLTVPVVTTPSEIPSASSGTAGFFSTADQAIYQVAKTLPSGYTGYVHVPLPSGGFVDVYAQNGNISTALPSGQPVVIQTGS
jgi:hypothetical protein